MPSQEMDYLQRAEEVLSRATHQGYEKASQKLTELQQMAKEMPGSISEYELQEAIDEHDAAARLLLDPSAYVRHVLHYDQDDCPYISNGRYDRPKRQPSPEED